MSALDNEQPVMPVASALKLTPTARPSGILCNGIMPISKIVRFFVLACDSFLSSIRLLMVINKPPIKNPVVGNSQEFCQSSLERLIAGMMSDQIDAEVINPALVLSMISSARLLIDLKQKTTAAPKAVRR